MAGILLLDKPMGMTSHDVVAKARKALGTREVGHAGTLDPNATGLLVLAIGAATRWLNHLPAGKSYRATLRLGLATDTEDVWGEPTAQDQGPAPEPAALRAALEGLSALTEQVPPMVSALKLDGRRLYQLAREGKTVERAPRPVSISAVRVLALRGQEADFEVDCGPGTYVRSLCVEAGRRLGRPACMTALRRLRSGPFSVEDALGVEQWTAAGLGPALMGASIALAHLPAKDLSEAEAADVGFGRSVAAPEGAAGTWRLNAAGRLLALAEAAPGGRLQPKRVFNA
jgi:tRNA pseudouridine55 synthase